MISPPLDACNPLSLFSVFPIPERFTERGGGFDDFGGRGAELVRVDAAEHADETDRISDRAGMVFDRRGDAADADPELAVFDGIAAFTDRSELGKKRVGA